MRVLLAVDESAHSQVAVKVVCARVWPAATKFRVMTALEGADGLAVAGSGQGATSAVAAGISGQVAGCEVETATVFGDAPDAILDNAEKWGADLIAMGSRGRSGITRMLLGSVSQAVLARAATAVLIARVPGNAVEAEELRTTMKRVVLAVDATEHSRAAVRWLSGLPGAEGTQIKVINVLEPLSAKYANGLSALQTRDIDWMNDADRKSAETLTQEVADAIKRKLPKVEVTTSLPMGEAASEIIKAARDFRAGLIVIGTRGNAGVTQVMLGSVSKDVVSKAGCPVEIVKWKAEEPG